jgi:hypothetical protein
LEDVRQQSQERLAQLSKQQVRAQMHALWVRLRARGRWLADHARSVQECSCMDRCPHAICSLPLHLLLLLPLPLLAGGAHVAADGGPAGGAAGQAGRPPAAPAGQSMRRLGCCNSPRHQRCTTSKFASSTNVGCPEQCPKHWAHAWPDSAWATGWV